MASKITGEVSPRKGSASSRHLVQHGAEGKQIGAGIEFLAARLLRRHVGHGSDSGAGTGQQLLIHRLLQHRP